MRLSVVLVNWNSRDDTAACLASLAAQTHEDLDVIVIDNGSEDGSAAMVRERFPTVRLVCEKDNLGFAEGCNRGILASSGAWVVLLNNDAVAEPGFARAIANAAERAPRTVGMLQALMLFQKDPASVNSTGIELTRAGGGRDRGENAPPPPIDAPEEPIFCPCGGAAAYRRAMLDALRLEHGYFDRRHFCYYEDMDLGWRARLAGWEALYVPGAVVHHRYHATTSRRGKAWMMRLEKVNRLRTLLKNASPGFIVRTLPTTIAGAFELAWHAGPGSLVDLARAIGPSLETRKQIAALARTGRRDIERAWVVR
jgi:GT2 family glycosyltransferase